MVLSLRIQPHQLKFGRRPNVFQQHLKQVVIRINSESRPFIKGDKSTFYYNIEAEQYNKLVDKEIHKDYKIASNKVIEKIDKGQKQVVKDLELADRVFETTELQAFATLKDHKENFYSNPKVRLIVTHQLWLIGSRTLKTSMPKHLLNLMLFHSTLQLPRSFSVMPSLGQEIL